MSRYVSLPTAFILFWKRAIDFKGTSSRSEFWWMFVINLMFILLIGPLATIMSPMIIISINAIYLLVLFIPGSALLYRRFLDTGLSPSIAVLLVIFRIVPTIGIFVKVISLALCALPTQELTKLRRHHWF